MTRYARPGKMGPTPREDDAAAEYAKKHNLGRLLEPKPGDCPHADWGYDESGEAYCHDCGRVVPISSVPRRDRAEARKLAAELEETRKGGGTG